MSKKEMTTIEINGIKMEVDLRHARRVEEIKVGSRVKILNSDATSPSVYGGIVIGFEPFTDLPTIIVAYMQSDWQGVDLKFAYINAKNDKWSMVVAIDDDHLDLSHANINANFDKKVSKLQGEIADIEEKKQYFNDMFQSYWEPVAAVHEPEVQD